MTNQRNPQPEYEDLTRFADENFDSDEVDLFQFSGNSETSPLTKLKSVILSLEWEITDEYLQELAEELAALAPSLQDDKVAKLYLQGMGKIGKYLRLRGAHAHANAIKLLLRYFYDFESILNSPDMDNERINKVVQNDVRMFKVLQYQIKLAEETPEEGEGQPGMATGVVRDTGKAGNALRLFKAAILELDWEVSNESLERFSDALKALSEEEIQNKSALILIQGMQALGDYISEQRAHAHPEVFNLLHAFHDGLERILDTGPAALDQKQKKRILVDRINRLNHLKKLIAPQDAEVPEAVPVAQAVAQAQARGAAAPVTEEAAPVIAEVPVAEAPAEEPALFEGVESALSDAPAPEAPAEEPALFDDVEPALSDAPVAEAPTEESALFDDVEPALSDAPASPAAAIPGVYTPDYDDDDVDPRFGGPVTPALSDVAPALSDAPAPEAPAGEPTLFDDVEPALAGEEPGPVAALSETDMDIKEAPTTGEGIAAEIDDLFGGSPARPATDGDEDFPAVPAGQGPVSPALTDADEEPSLSFAEETGQTEDAELDGQLDAFFGESTAPPPPPEAPGPPPVAPAAALSGVGGEDDEDELDLFPPTSGTDDLPSALADADEPREELELGAEDAELSAKLDSFFDFPSEPAPAAPAVPVAEPDDALSLDADLFAEEPTPALADMEAPAAPAVDEETLSLDADLFAEEPAPALTDAEAPAVPADDTLLFEDEPAAPTLADEEGEDTLLFIDEPAPSQPDLLGQTAPAPADDILFGEEPAAPAAPVVEAPADEPVAALADTDEAGEESLILEADEELSAHLDNFFDIPGEPTPEAPAAPTEEPAPALADAAPTDDMLLFDEEPATSLADDAALFSEAPAAPADDMLLFEDEPAAPAALADEPVHDGPVAALADAAPEEGTLTFEADEELSAHLDNFFDIPGESAPEAPAALADEAAEAPALDADEDLLFADEPAAPAAEESPAEESGLFLDESDSVAETPAAPTDETTLFADEPLAPVAEEPGLFLDESDLAAETPAPPVAIVETEEPGLFLDESELEAEAASGTTLFADGSVDEAPALDIPDEEQQAAAQPKVFEEVVAALADVEPGRGKSSLATAEADAGFQDQLDSFFDVPESAQEAPPPEEEATIVFDGEPEAPAAQTEETLTIGEDEAPAEETFAASADDAALFAEAGEGPPAAPADDSLFFADEPAAQPAEDAMLFAENAEASSADTLTLDEDLFGPTEGAEPSTPVAEEEGLRLEKKAAPADFDDLVDSAEVHDFLVSGGDIEDIPDEELALVEEEEAALRQAAPEAPPVEEALAGAFDEPESGAPLFGEEEKGTLAAMDDLFGAQDEDHAIAPQEPVSVEDVVADESVLFAEPEAVSDETMLFADEAPVAETPAYEASVAPAAPQASSGMAALAASLPGLIAGYTADQLSDCRDRLVALRHEGGLSPVQQAAAGMLESVLTAMPEAAAQPDATTGSLLEGLYTALAEPQANLPIETVTAFSAWVQSHVSGKRQTAPAPEGERGDFLRELAEFRSHMERELAELRAELKKKKR